MTASKQKFTVNEQEGGRLDACLVTHLPEISRRRANELCSEGLVLVNGQRKKGGARVESGDTIELLTEILVVAARPDLGALSTVSLPVIYQDQDLIAISKPRLLHSVRLRSDDPVTVADIIAAQFPECLLASPDPREAGLINRLDFSTSGILLAARSRKSWEQLRGALLADRVEKDYLALIVGVLEQESVTTQYQLLLEGETVRLARPGEEGAETRTNFSQIKVLHGRNGKTPLSIVRANAHRARRHQIRAHLSFLGVPLLGDRQYGAIRSLDLVAGELTQCGESTEGFLLFAERVLFEHPVSGKVIEVVDRSPVFELLLR